MFSRIIVAFCVLCIPLTNAFLPVNPVTSGVSTTVQSNGPTMLFGGIGKNFRLGKSGVVSGRRFGSSLRKNLPKIFGPTGSGIAGGNGNVPPGLGSSAEASGDDNDDKPSNPLEAFLKSYDEATNKNPILIKGLTSLVGFFIGDLLAQKFIDAGEEFDVARIVRLASFGLLFHGPSGHFFYGFLDGKLPGTSPLIVATKVAIDQLIWNPIFGCAFFSYLGLTQGQTIEEIKMKIKNDLWDAVRGSWTVWPIAHAINFAFIPNSQRLLYINSIQIFYNMFLSFIGNKGGDEVVEVEE